DPYRIDRPAGQLKQFPPATLRILGWNLAAGGGAWFRIFPYALIRAALRACQQRNVPATFYIHPWEIDPDQPVVEAPLKDRWKHYAGLGRAPARLKRLLQEFRFCPIASTVGAV